jgi:hypothetical protein
LIRPIDTSCAANNYCGPYLTTDDNANVNIYVDVEYTRPDGSTYDLPMHLDLAKGSATGVNRIDYQGHGGIDRTNDEVLGRVARTTSSITLVVGQDSIGNVEEVPEF